MLQKRYGFSSHNCPPSLRPTLLRTSALVSFRSKAVLGGASSHAHAWGAAVLWRRALPTSLTPSCKPPHFIFCNFPTSSLLTNIFAPLIAQQRRSCKFCIIPPSSFQQPLPHHLHIPTFALPPHTIIPHMRTIKIFTILIRIALRS